ncbi:S26 family signal peptidase [Geobacter grbiciae]|uniref:S26 family signal peptidase n=1 Tax=Geobacter grbiciae TaxID=155042 RepID=UPI001C01C58F|nr:S26 family signal peptidase [Geobacter grbiciae]MBT1077204.1 S26 family signal peptidase [Geobacter grbiciae]
MRINKKPLFIAVTVVVCLAVMQIINSLTGPYFVLNLSSSEPLGIYRLKPFSGTLRRGEIVWMKAPQKAGAFIYDRGWLPRGWPLLKHIKAIPGDIFCITDTSLTVNGALVGPVSDRDRKGQTLPRIRGCSDVAAGHFLPVATNIANSFDGRYFGTVPASSIIAVATPVMTF